MDHAAGPQLRTKRSKMTKNMGTVDRVIRTGAGLGIAILYFTGRISETLALVLGAFAIIFLVTSVIAWCPLYTPLGISTRKLRPASRR